MSCASCHRGHPVADEQLLKGADSPASSTTKTGFRHRTQQHQPLRFFLLLRLVLLQRLLLLLRGVLLVCGGEYSLVVDLPLLPAARRDRLLQRSRFEPGTLVTLLHCVSRRGLRESALGELQLQALHFLLLLLLLLLLR